MKLLLKILFCIFTMNTAVGEVQYATVANFFTGESSQKTVVNVITNETQTATEHSTTAQQAQAQSLAPNTPAYDFTPDPDGNNVTLYKGTTGTDGNPNAPLFMTDDPNYAAQYVQNGGRVVEVTIPRSTFNLMQLNGMLEVSPFPQLHVNGTSGIEYKFSPAIRSTIEGLYK